jgi:hypothetical protein
VVLPGQEDEDAPRDTFCDVRWDVRAPPKQVPPLSREFFVDNLLVRIHSVIEMIWWTGFALWEFEFPFPSSLIFAGSDTICDVR